MKFIILLSIFSAILIRIKRPLFETLFTAILLLPLIAYAFGLLLNTGLVLNLSLSGALLFLLFYFAPHYTGPELKELWWKRIKPLLLFALSFTFIHYFTLLWPDFISIGERLRDYAILAAAVKSPVVIPEPWMDGYNLNYYAYWYRLGAFFASILGIEVWELYHQLQAFCFSLFFVALYLIFRRHLKFSSFSSLACSLITVFGSNAAGVKFALSANNNWWAPSRVISGAINEFPAWSFLLGDLHPHYLNLCFLPFFILCFLSFGKNLEDSPLKQVLVICSIIVLPLWLYNSNAWELPILLGVLLSVLFFALLSGEFKLGSLKTFASTEKLKHLVRLPQFYVLLAISVILVVALYDSATNISSGGHSWRFVSDKIGRTPLSEFMMHWGVPLSLFTISQLILLRKNSFRLIALLLVAGLLSLNYVWPLLIALFVINMVRVLPQLKARWTQNERFDWLFFIFEGLSFAVIVFLLLPEFVFLDDPYGAEIERMNTIFKFYSATWSLLYIATFYLFGKAFKKLLNRPWRRINFHLLQIMVLGVLLAFFVKGAGLRFMPNILPEDRSEGLSSIERQFSGAKVVIRRLRDEKEGTVLEAQGKPYSYTTHVATLAAKPSYLGWANHMGLLLRNHGDIKLREDITRRIYKKETGCIDKQRIAIESSINYIVLGPLEKQQYLNLSEQDFACMTKLISSGQYTVFRP